MATNVLIGSMINNYEILERIGRGGMGDVYLAKHPQIGKKVAIKLLKPGGPKTAEVAQRFWHEAMVVEEIHHQNVVDVLDFGQTPEGERYIIMEYLEGEPLTSLIVGGEPLSLEFIGHIGLQLCSALASAHSKGVIHRDLKSENVFIIDRDSAKSFVKLIDFGIAKLLDHSVEMLTLDGFTMGTPLYMSPEQAMGRPISGQTDIYALGVLLYYMATKSYPFFDANPVVIANMQVFAPLPLPSARFAGVDLALEAVIVRCLEKEQELRYGSMLEVAAALGLVCGLDVDSYFGKTRDHSLPRIIVPAFVSSTAVTPEELLLSEVFAPRELSAQLIPSEVIVVPKSKARSPMVVALLVALLGAGLFATLREESQSPPRDSAVPTLPAPSFALFTITPSTSGPVAPQKLAPKKRVGAFKKLRGFFSKGGAQKFSN